MPIDKSTILLVDDNKDDLIFFDEALSKLDIPYFLFYSPYYSRHVFQLLDEHKINIMFLDINMPGKTGLQFLEEIKADKKYQHIPVVMYSISAREEDIKKSFELGAHLYLVKPYAHFNLVESLRKIFKLDWTTAQPSVSFESFVINLAFA
jgi:CheY-like chemotaxis protein